MAPSTVLHAPLSARRRGMLRAISDFSDIHGYPPTMRELTQMIGLASVSTTYRHLEILREAELVTWLGESSRTLVVTPQGRHAIHDAL